MSNTKIVLNRQSDLILDNAEITAPVGIVLADIAGAPEAINALDEKTNANLNTESSLRVAGDAAEASSREAAVSTLDTKTGNAMTAEQSQRVAGDANLQNQIDNVLSNVDGAALDSLTEIVTAFQSADGDLNGAIIALSEAATSSLSAEVEARISDVDAEQARAESATISLFERTKYEIGMAIDGEQARAESAEAVLTADLSAEESARIADVDAEESRAIEAEEMLAADLSFEVAAREAAISTEESARIADVDAEESRAIEAEGSLATVIAAEHSEHIANELSIVTAMDAADSAEASARIAGDALLTANLSVEVATRIADGEKFTNGLNAEGVRAGNAEVSLATDLASEIMNRGNAIDNEQSARIDGDQSLQNQIDFITDNTDAAAIDSLTEIVAAFQSADGEINGAITTLAGAAGANLSTEVARATSAEAVLTADLSSEASARIAADYQIGDRFDSVIEDMFNSDMILENAIIAEESNRIADVDAEESRAISAEGVLTAALSHEVSTRFAEDTKEASYRVAADASLTSDLSSGLSTEASARFAEDTKEASYRVAADASLTSDLSTEASTRLYLDNKEESYRVAGDLSLQNQIDFITENIDPVAIDSLTEIVAAFQNADGDINGAISELADAAGANLSTEVARAESAEAVLTADLSSEVAAREAAVSAEVSDLNASIDEQASIRIAADTAEESRAIEAEGVLTAALSHEVSKRAEDMDTEVSARIADVDAEESRAIAAEGVLTSDLSTEVAAREAAVSHEVSVRIADSEKLTTALNAEISNREEDVDNEEYRATEAEASLASDLSSEVDARGTAVDAEASYRVSGDLSLQNQIDFITSNVDAAAIDSLTEIVSAFQSADGDINGAITELADAAGANLSTEVERADSAEKSLAADLSSEASAREAAVSALDTKTGNAMTAEVSNRIADVDAEESRATSAEVHLIGELINSDNKREQLKSDLSTEVSTEVAAREAAISAEESMRVEADASIAAELSSDIEALADVDGTTIVLNGGTNQIELAEEVAAPASGIRTLMGEIDIETILKVGGVDVMAAMSSADASIETAVGFNDMSSNELIEYNLFLDYLSGTQTYTHPFGDVYATEDFVTEFGPANYANFAYFNNYHNLDNVKHALLQNDASLEVALSTEVSYLIANTDLGSIDSFAEIVSELSGEIVRAESAEVSIDTAVNNLSTNTGDYVIEMMPRIHGVNESPDGTIVAFTADVIASSAVVFLNGLMLTAGEDYTPTYVAHLASFTFDFISAPAATDKVNVYGVHFGTTFNGVNE